MSEAVNAPSPSPRPKNKIWIFYFVFVVVAALGVAGFMIWYNRSLQLTREVLDAAEKRWTESKILNYDMEFKKKLNDGEWSKFKVKVSNGKVVEATMNGRPLVASEGGEDPLPYLSMNAHFRDLSRFLDIDAKPNAPKVYFLADFDQKTGAIVGYTRYNSSQNQRVEMVFTYMKVVAN